MLKIHKQLYNKDFNNVLIFRSGLIGDTLVSIPAISVIKKKLPNSKLFMVSLVIKKNQITPKDILFNSDLIDSFIELRFYNYVLLLFDIFYLIILIVKNKINTVFLLENYDFNYRLKKIFFKILGVPNIIAVNKMLHESISENLIKNINYYFKTKKTINYNFKFTIDETNKVNNWFSILEITNEFYSMAINSNFASKVWDMNNYIFITKELYNKYNIIPVLLGGMKDWENNEHFIQQSGIGFNVAGKFTIRESIYLTSKSKFYLGNDTGVMHMAAINNVKCFAIFSSIEKNLKWRPLGKENVIFRTKIECEGCLLRKCVVHDNLCLKLIDKSIVLMEINKFLLKKNDK